MPGCSWAFSAAWRGRVPGLPAIRQSQREDAATNSGVRHHRVAGGAARLQPDVGEWNVDVLAVSSRAPLDTAKRAAAPDTMLHNTRPLSSGSSACTKADFWPRTSARFPESGRRE